MQHSTRLSPAFDAYIASARAYPAPWRLICGLIILLLVYSLLNGAPLFVLAALQGPETVGLLLSKLSVASTPDTLLIVLATFLPLVLGVFVAARTMHKRKAGTLLGSRRLVSRHFWIATAVMGALFALFVVLWSLQNQPQPNLPLALWLRFLPLTLIGIALQTLAEELLFRGYLQQQLAARFSSRWVWAFLPSVVFGALHYAPATLGEGAFFAALSATVFGLIAADLTSRTGSLGAAWGVHFANNVVALACLATQGTLTGLALYVTPYDVSDLGDNPFVMLLDLTPMLAGWLILRHILHPKPPRA